MVRKFGAFVAKEVREVLPATILFLFLFHMIALTELARAVGAERVKEMLFGTDRVEVSDEP